MRDLNFYTGTGVSFICQLGTSTAIVYVSWDPSPSSVIRLEVAVSNRDLYARVEIQISYFAPDHEKKKTFSCLSFINLKRPVYQRFLTLHFVGVCYTFVNLYEHKVILK